MTRVITVPLDADNPRNDSFDDGFSLAALESRAGRVDLLFPDGNADQAGVFCGPANLSYTSRLGVLAVIVLASP